MKAVIQRVREAKVIVDDQVVGQIGTGLLTLLGIAKGDDEAKARAMISKIAQLRIFEDENGKMNHSLLDLRAEHLIVSQFTLLADCSSGRRPSFTQAEIPERARELYMIATEQSRNLGIQTAEGIFQADMKVSLINDGPVTLIIEI